jgi:hypothetical protein
MYKISKSNKSLTLKGAGSKSTLSIMEACENPLFESITLWIVRFAVRFGGETEKAFARAEIKLGQDAQV